MPVQFCMRHKTLTMGQQNPGSAATINAGYGPDLEKTSPSHALGK